MKTGKSRRAVLTEAAACDVAFSVFLFPHGDSTQKELGITKNEGRTW